MNSLDGWIKANAAIAGLGTGGAVSTFVTDIAHIIMDVNGYFVPPRNGRSAGLLSRHAVPRRGHSQHRRRRLRIGHAAH